MTISEKLRQQVIVAADYRCEYCKTSSRLTGTPPVMEHILPRSRMTKLIDGSDRISTQQV